MIYGFLKQILSARYGRDVRQAIHDAIQQCYYDGKAGSIDMEARESVETLNGEVKALKEADIVINESIDILESDVAGLKESTETMSEDIETMQSMLQGTNDITTTTETTMPNSHEGRLLFKEIRGKTEKATSTGSQLFDGRNVELGSISSAFGTKEDNTTICRTINPISVNPSTKYVLSYTSGSSTRFIRVFQYDSSMNFIESFIVYSEVPFETNQNAKYLHMHMSGTSFPSDTTLNIGETPLPWETYTGGISAPYIKSVSISKIKTHRNNLFDYSKAINEYITNDGELAYHPCVIMSCYIPSNGNVTVSVNKSILAIVINCFDINKNHISKNIFENCSVAKLEAVENCAYVRVAFTVDDSDLDITRLLTYEPMVNEGDTALPYEPYNVVTFSSPIELNKIGDVQDVIVDGKPIRRITQKRITSGMAIEQSPDWANKQAFLINDFFADGVQVYDAEFATVANIMCTHAPTSSAAEIAGGSVMNGVAQNLGDNVYFSFENCATLDAVKTFLDNNAVYVYYELATPITTLPTADQVALNSLKTCDGTTYLEFDSPLQPEFVAEYGTSKVGGVALANSLILNGDYFEFAEHGLTFKGLKVGNMVIVHASGALDYAITEENKIMTFNSVIPEGFRPIATTHASCVGITHKDSEGNKITDMFNLGIGGSGAIGVQVELKNNAGQSITVSKPGLPLNMSISYISE